MRDADTGREGRSMRADARRNRQRLVAAATELVLEMGGEPPRDAVAQRAGVGIATLYRNFPEQQDLLRAVVLDVLDRTIAAGHAALDESEGGGTALGRYLHAAIDTGLGVVNIVHPLLDDTDWPDQTAKARDVLGRLVTDARRAGAIGQHVTEDDVVFAAIRFSRPLAIGVDSETERNIAHRQLDHYLAGLAATAEGPGAVRVSGGAGSIRSSS